MHGAPRQPGLRLALEAEVLAAADIPASFMPAAPTMLTNRYIINSADKQRMVSSRPIIRVNLGGRRWSRSKTAAPLDGEYCGVEHVTGATKQ